MIDFVDPGNPTHDVIIKWAYDQTVEEPISQDWDLIIADIDNGYLFLKLSSDNTCPKKDFFLNCLYLLVGDTVRTNGLAHDKTEVKKIVNVGRFKGDQRIRKWVNESDFLFENPKTFDYEIWCDGGWNKLS